MRAGDSRGSSRFLGLRSSAEIPKPARTPSNLTPRNLPLSWENRITVTGADPSGKASRIIRSAAPLPYRFGGSEPNGEIKILDAETIK